MQVTLADLVLRFERGDIRLPLMQRDYLWKGRKVVQLLDSLYRGWPIGSFYIWRTHERHSTKLSSRNLSTRRLPAGFFGFLLDGQQRLTSLVLAIQGTAEGQPESRAYFDLANDTFVLGGASKRIARRIERHDPMLVPLYEVVELEKENKGEIVAERDRRMRAIEEQELVPQGELPDLREKFARLQQMLQRHALCEYFEDDDEEHAFELFARLNKGGTTLQAGDVEAAKLASQATRSIVGPMREIAAEREIHALGINFIFLLRALVTVHRGSARFSDLPKSWTQDAKGIAESWRQAEAALRAVLRFVREDMGWRSRRWLPSTNALLPLVYVLAKTDSSRLSAGEAALVRRYLLVTGLRSHFQGSPETTVNGFVNAVRESRAGRENRLRLLLEKIPKNKRVPLRGDEVQSARGPYSPLMQVYYSYAFETGIPSWPGGARLSALDELGPGGQVVSHPVFQRFLAEDTGLPPEALSSSANFVLLNKADAKLLTGEAPIESWRRMKPAERSIARRQLFLSDSENLLYPASYSAFLDFRSRKLAEALNDYIGLSSA